MRRTTMPCATWLCVGVVAASGCSSAEAPRAETDPGPLLAETPSATARAIGALRGSASFASALHDGARLERRGDAWVVAGLARASTSVGDSMHATAPARADGAAVLADERVPGLALRVRALDVAPRAAQPFANSAVFADAQPDVDVVHVLSPGRFEDLRVLHAVSGGVVHVREALSFDAPQGSTLRVREGRLELVEPNGHVALGTAPAFAEDARGERRALAISLDRRGREWLVDLALDTRGLVAPVVVDPAWTAITPMTFGRFNACSATLAGGRLLVVGGTGSTTTAEIYEPAANTWTLTPPLPGPLRRDSTVPNCAFTTAAGKVVTIGTTGVYLYDGTTWTKPSLGPTTAKRSFALAQLADGRVVQSGGVVVATAAPSSTADVYDPIANTWTATGPMHEVRDLHVSALVGGKILVADGEVTTATATGSTSLTTAELLDPTTLQWTTTGATAAAHSGGTLVALPGNKAIVIGGAAWLPPLPGTTQGYVVTSEVYDLASGTWRAGTPPPSPRQYAAMTVLTSGDLLIGSNPFYRYATATESWSFAGDLPTVVRRGAVFALPGDRALNAGGILGSSPSNTVSIYQRSPLAAACAGGEDCVSGACVDGVCCGSASCPNGSVCNSATAAGRCAKLAGLGCGVDADCATGHCADGVCCDVACNGQCEACDALGALGTCTAIAGAPHGGRAACAAVEGDACKSARCDGTQRTACQLPGAGSACGANRCTAGTERHVGACNGAGACVDVPKSCGVYACGATACSTSCTSVADCVGGYFCDAASHACTPVVGLGTACADGTQCAAGLYCTDGVCCGAASCGAGRSCALAGHVGVCVTAPGKPCGADGECGTGNCVDGVCCDTSCAGACAACDVKGSEGTCTAVVGAPHGTRAACAIDGSAPCASRACDGKDLTQCAGYVGAEVRCRAAGCDDAAAGATLAVQCDGAGKCPDATRSSCGGFLCDGPACRTHCASDGDCQAAFACESGLCQPKTSRCSDDGRGVVAKDGSVQACDPFLCRAGACLEACATSNDCLAGLLCSYATHACVSAAAPPPADAASSGGCQLDPRGGMGGARSTPAAPAGTLVLLVAAAIGWRRRGRRSARGALLLGGALASVGLGCGQAGVVASSTADAGAAPPAVAPPSRADREATLARADQAIAHVRGVRLPGAARFGVGALERGRGGFVIRGAPTTRGALEATLPASAGAPLHLAEVGAVDAWLDVRALDVGDAKGTTHDGALVIEAQPGLTILHGPSGAGVEELRLLDAHAPATHRWTLRAGPAITTLRVREGRIEALDATGRLRFGTAPLRAVDARGRALRVDVVRIERDGAGAASAASASSASRETLVEARVDVEGAARPIVLDPFWSTVAPMAEQHIGGASTQLADGRVFVAGGQRDGLDSFGTSTVELFDPTSRTWSNGRPMLTARIGHGVERVGGRLLVMGGQAGGVPRSTTCEWYDIAANTWSAGPSLAAPRQVFQTASFPSGQVLVIAGEDATSAGLSSTELYDPTTGAFRSGGNLSAAREGFGVVLLGGKLLVAGGVDAATADAVSAVDVYDPAAGWSAVPSMSAARYTPTAFNGPDGKAWLVGGMFNAFSGTTLSTAEAYDVATSRWSALPSMRLARVSCGLAFVAGGRPLLVGGQGYGGAGLASTELFDTTSNAWIAGPPLPYRRMPAWTYPMGGGATVMVGGIAFDNTAETDVLAPAPLGTSCAIAAECGSFACVDFACCGTSSCPAGKSCNSTAHAGACATVNGGTCAADAECGSGHCIDGVCCESTCGASCGACDVAGHLGKCWPVAGAPHHARAACTGAGAGTACGPTCDGVDAAACHPVPSGHACGADGCAAGVETHVGACDGAGACVATTRSCGVYTCAGTTCVTSCSSSAQCAVGSFCAAGSCVPLEGKGVACAADAQCASGLSCVDKVCCSSAACDAGARCDSAGARGDCRKVLAQACAADGDCASGHCVDGRCCDGACDGSCEACDVVGHLGACTPVLGAPHPTHPACPSDAADACSAATCDGAERKACKAFPSSDVRCRAARCADGVETAPADCDGSGKCPALVTSACGGYACDSAAERCLAGTCRKPSDCVAGYTCLGGTCQRDAGACSPDGTSLVAADGSEATCAPFLCRGVACLASCKDTNDCAPGYSCDATSGGCSLASQGAAASSGCAVGVIAAPGEDGPARSGDGGAGTRATLAALAAIAGLAALGRGGRRRGSGRGRTAV